MSANGSLSSMSANGNGGLSAMSAGNSLTTASTGNYTISAMSSGSATTCYKSKDKYYDVTITPVIKQSYMIDSYSELEDGGRRASYLYHPVWSLGFEITPELEKYVGNNFYFFPTWKGDKYHFRGGTSHDYWPNPILLPKIENDEGIVEYYKFMNEVFRKCKDDKTSECKILYDQLDNMSLNSNMFYATMSKTTMWVINQPAPLGWSNIYSKDELTAYSIFAGHIEDQTFYHNIILSMDKYREDVANEICDAIREESGYFAIDGAWDENGNYMDSIIISPEDVKWGDCKFEFEGNNFPATVKILNNSNEYAHLDTYYTIMKVTNTYDCPSHINNDGAYYECDCDNPQSQIPVMLNRLDDSHDDYGCNCRDFAHCYFDDDSEYMHGLSSPFDYKSDPRPTLHLFIGSLNTTFEYTITDVQGKVFRGGSSNDAETSAYSYTLMWSDDGDDRHEDLTELFRGNIPPGKYTLTVKTTGGKTYSSKTDRKIFDCVDTPEPLIIKFYISGSNEHEYLYVTPNTCKLKTGEANSPDSTTY